MKDNNYFQLNTKSGSYHRYCYFPIDVSDAQQVEYRAMEYINNCIFFNTYPTVTGLCNALGINRRTFHRWECGLYRAKTHQGLAVKYKNLLEEFLLFSQGLPRSEFVFTHEDGTMLHPQSPTSYMKHLGKKCGIVSLHPHALRHTMASLSIANGADIVSVSQKLGHSEVSTTLNIYAHENEEAKERASQVLNDILYIKQA